MHIHIDGLKTLPPIFVLGAGFNIDASSDVGPAIGESIYIGRYEIQCKYPLLPELERICFPDESDLSRREIEQRLADSVEAEDFNPVERLASELMKADYYLAGALAFSLSESRYRRFIDTFPESHFLTFNYDSLVELMLLRQGRWSPMDGYGVEVEAEVSPFWDEEAPPQTANLVLHLHGSLCVHSRDFSFGPPDQSGIRWMDVKDEPDFLFDPHSLGSLFSPFSRVMPGLSGFTPLGQRIIAPVPDKVSDLRATFHHRVYKRAVELVSAHGPLVAIGYDFGMHDRNSFEPLLEAAAVSDTDRVVVVAPNANETVSRIETEFPEVAWAPIALTFAEWADEGYAGI